MRYDAGTARGVPLALSQLQRKASAKAFDLVLQEERVRSTEVAREEENLQVVVSHAQARFGNMRLAGALDLGPSLQAGGADSGFLSGDAGFLYDQMSLALAGFDTGLLGPDASNAAVQDAMGSASVGLSTSDFAGGVESASLRAASRDADGLDYDPYHPAVRNMHSRAGAPLPSTVAARIGAAFGHDFSHVRVHTDAGAAAAAEALNARAFAIGSEIWFGRGAFNPGTPEGDRILAHELTHVVQHEEGRLPSATGEGLSVSSPTDTAEREAYANEQTIVSQLSGPSTAGTGESIVDSAMSLNSADTASQIESSSGGAMESASAGESSVSDAGDVAHRDGLGKRMGKVKPEVSLRPGGGIPVPEVKGNLDLGIVNVDAKVQLGLPGGEGEEKSPKQLLNAAAQGLAGLKPADMDVMDRNGNRSESLLAGNGSGAGVNIRAGGNSGVSIDAKVGGGNNAVSVNANVGSGGNNLAINGNLGAGGNNLAVAGNVGAGGNSLSIDGNLGAGGNSLAIAGNLGTGGSSLAVSGNLDAGGLSVAGNATVNADGVQANVDATLNAAGLDINAAAKLGPDGLKASLDAKTGDAKTADADKKKAPGEGDDKDKKDAKGGKEGDKKKGEGDAKDAKKEGAPEGKGGPGKEGAAGGGGGGGGGGGSGGGGGGDMLAGLGGAMLTAGPVSSGAGPRELGKLILPKFDLKKEEISKLKKNTGKTPDQHQAAIHEHTERIKVQVDQMREGLRVYAAEHVMGIDTEITAQVNALGGDISSAKGRVTAAYESAKGALATAATEGLGSIATAARTARETLATSLPAQQQRLLTMVTEGKGRATALAPTWKDNFKKALDDGAKGFEKVAEECAKELGTAKAGIVNTWPDEGDALARAENEARRKAASKGVDDAVADFRTGGGQKAAQARAQAATYNTQIDTAIAAVNAAFDAMQRDGGAQLQAAHDRAVTQIASQTAEGETAVTGAQATAHTALSTAETTAQGELDTAQTTNAASITSAGTQAKEAISSTDLSLREQYAQWFDGVLAGLPTSQATTYDSVKEYLEGKERELPGFNSGIMEQLGVGCDNAIKMVTDAGAAAKAALTQLADSSVAQAASQAKAQADGIRATATQFATSISQTGTAIETAFVQHIGPMSGGVEQRITLTVEQMTGALEQAKAAFITQAAAYGVQLRQRITMMPQTLRPMADAAGAGVYRNLSDRAQRVHSACKGMGTDENAVYNALRGLTALSGAAFQSVVWPRLFAAEGDFASFLIDDLNEDEQKIAFAYLRGNTALGARLELDASIHWYGDDEAQIERILRELSPEDLAAMKNDPGWATTRQRLTDNLGGTDLDVTNALLVGNAARADAYRLRDKIDEARRDGDPDALHTALQGVDPATLAAVQQEFHNIRNGVDAGATNVPQVDQALAAQELGAYVTRDIERYDPNTGEMVTDKVTGANADLARALAMEGRDSTQAAVSRFEVERGRSGGPNMENMETALMAPPGLQERLHSPDEQVRLAAQAEQDQREATIRNRYTEQYGGAEGRSMDQAIDGMMSGRNDKEAETSRRLMHNMLSDGTNSPRVAADMIALAADGAGTNEAQIKRALTGLRPDEVTQVDAAYRAQHGESLYSRLGVAERDANGNKIPGADHSEQWFNELSGDDRRQVEELLQGDPRYMTTQQQLALARSQYDWQRGSESGGMGSALMDGGAEQKDLDRNFNNLNTLAQRRRPDGTFQNPEDQREFERLCGDVGINAAQYQAGVDRTANYITTGVAIVGAVVVTAVTFGSGAPAGAAMIIAATGTAASGAISMGVNAGMKGGRYGYEQAATDAGITAVQTLTAGAGAYLNAMNAGTGVLRATTPLQKAFAEGAVGAGTGFVNGAAQTAMTDGTWDKGLGSGLLTTLEGGGKQALTEGITSAASAGIEETRIGKALEESGLAGSALIKGTSNAAGAVLGTSAGIGYDAARGRFKGDLADAAGQVGTEAGKQFVIGAAGGIAGRAARPLFNQGAPSGPGPGPAGPGDDSGPPPSGPAVGPSGPDNNNPPPPGSGSTSTETPRTDTSQTSQRPVGNPDAGRTDAPPSTPRSDVNVDPNTGRPPAGTSTDAATQNVRPDAQGQRGNGGTNDTDGQVVRTPEGTTVISNTRVVKATDEGVVTINRDGTKDVVDTAGNRTHIDAAGNQKTITPDGTAILRDTDGTAVVVRGDEHIAVDTNGRPVSDTSEPRKIDDATREHKVLDDLQTLLDTGKLTYDEAWRVMATPGGPAAQEAALRATEARIAQDDMVMNRLIDLTNMVRPDGSRVVSEAEVSQVLNAPDMVQALKNLDAKVATQRADGAATDQTTPAPRPDHTGVDAVDAVFDSLASGVSGVRDQTSSPDSATAAGGPTADSTRTNGSLDSSRPGDVLAMHSSQFSQDVAAQRTLFEAAGAAVTRMKAAAGEIVADLPNVDVSSLRKRDDFESFVAEVMKKQTTKGYREVGEMSDIVRGRFNVESGADMATVAQRLQERFGTDVVEVKPPRDGYPRWHVNVRDAETGLVHEWQIGTKSTTDFFERQSLTIPPSVTQFKGRNDFHDGVYKLLNKITDPALRAQYGIDEMMVGYKALTEETGAVAKGQTEPQNYKQRYDDLSRSISDKLARIESDQPGFFDRLLSGGADASKTANPANANGAANANSTPDAARSTQEVAPTKAAGTAETPRAPGSLDPTKATDVLAMHHSSFATDQAAQHTLFDAAGAAVGRMKEAATDIVSDMPGTEASSLRKRDDFDSFVVEVLKKQTTKNYPNIGEMSDIVRGRFNCASGDDMAVIAQRLQERFGSDVVEVKPPRDGYPRWHVNVRDAETGLVHEWQIGTKSTTDFFETRSLTIPASITEFTGRNDFHDGVYKLLNKVKDPAVRAQYGIDEMMVGYKALTEETGQVSRETPLPANYKERYEAMAKAISDKIAAIEADKPGYLNALLKGGGGGH